MLLQEEDEPESMELDQAPATIPVPAPDNPLLKRKRGRPPKNPPKPPPPSKSMKTTVQSPAAGENAQTQVFGFSSKVKGSAFICLRLKSKLCFVLE